MRSCKLIPEVNGEPSQLYLDLKKEISNRPLLNYIYSCYSLPGVAEKMDSLKCRRDSLGQHRAKDVLEFLKVGNIISESTEAIRQQAFSYNIKSIDGKYVQYDSAEEAYEKAAQINNDGRVVAEVVSVGNKYEIRLKYLNANTVKYILDNEVKLSNWKLLKTLLTKLDLDILSKDSLTSGIFNPNNNFYLLHYLDAIANKTRPSNWTSSDIQVILHVCKNTAPNLYQAFIDNLKNDLGDQYNEDTIISTLKELIQKKVNNLSNSTVQLAERVLKRGVSELKSLNTNSLVDELQSNEDKIKESSKASAVVDAYKELSSKYGVNEEIIYTRGKEINSMREALADAIHVIQQNIRDLEEKDNRAKNSVEYKRLSSIKKNLSEEIEGNTAVVGALKYVEFTNERVQELLSLYNDNIALLEADGTDLSFEDIVKRAKLISEFRTFIEDNKPILKVLNDKEFLSEEVFEEFHIGLLSEQADTTLKTLSNLDAKLTNSIYATVEGAVSNIVGESPNREATIKEIMTFAVTDSSLYDYTYSIGKVSNALIGTMGGILREAQDERDAKLVEIQKRIRQATNKLYRAGYDSSFMYDGGHLLSIVGPDESIDFNSYNEAKKEYEKKLRKNKNLDRATREELMLDWEENNTEDYVVDRKSGRTERIPNSSYRKKAPYLSNAQMEYYLTMMQIKGELGTLLPAHAQKHFQPVQIRKSFLNIINDSKKLGFKRTMASLKEWIASMWTWREEDYEGSTVGDKDYYYSGGSRMGKEIRKIPVFFVGDSSINPDDILLDFSGALNEFAGMAVNYEAVAKVREVIELIGGYVSSKTITDSKKGKDLADVIKEKGLTLYKTLVKTDSLNSNLISQFIDREIYGNRLNTKNAFTKIISGLLGWNSVVTLAANVFGGLANWIQAEYQMLIEAGGGEFYSKRDYLWAALAINKDFIKSLEDTTDITKKKGKINLLGDLFDPVPGKVKERSHKRFFKNKFIKFLNTIDNNKLILYSGGEAFAHYQGMYAVLHNTKVTQFGKEKTLYDVIKVVDDGYGNAHLEIGPDVTYKDMNGNEVPLTNLDNDFIKEVKKKVRYVNESTFGAMSDESKGIIHKHIFGRMVMQFRQWMIRHYERRYRKRYWDSDLQQWREGYWNIATKHYISRNRVLSNIYKIFTHQQIYNTLSWDSLSDTEKQAVKKWNTEVLLFLALLLIQTPAVLGEKEDYEEDYWYKLLAFQIKKAFADASSANPVGFVSQAYGINDNLIASFSTVNKLLYPIVGLGDLDDEIQSGRYQGWNKYGRNLLWYTVPFYKNIDQLMYFDTKEGNDKFQQFEVSQRYR